VPSSLLIDEFHVSVRAPRGLPDAVYLAMRHALDEKRFQAELRRSVRAVLHRYPALLRARITVTR
jgi:hypothetical protein